MAIRGIRQGIPGGYILGRKGGVRGSVGLLPITPAGQVGTGASGTATGGGFVPQVSQPNGNLAFNNAGVWSATSAYNPGDVVTYNGGAYVNYVAVTSPGPNPSPDIDDAHWFSQGAVNTVNTGNFTLTTGQLNLNVDQPGVTTSSNAPAGDKGEYISSAVLAGSGVNCGNNAVTNITSISLTAGDWDVGANIVIANTGANLTNAQGIIATTNSGAGDQSQRALLTMSGVTIFGAAIGTQRFSLAASGSAFLNVFVQFGAGTTAGSGLLWARRVR